MRSSGGCEMWQYTANSEDRIAGNRGRLKDDWNTHWNTTQNAFLCGLVLDAFAGYRLLLRSEVSMRSCSTSIVIFQDQHGRSTPPKWNPWIQSIPRPAISPISSWL
jgi:hypothetical protein